MIRLVLPYPPSANEYKLTRTYFDKRTREWRTMYYLSDVAKTFKSEVGWAAKAAGLRQPLRGYVRLVLYLTPHCPKDAAERATKDPVHWPLKVQSLDVGNVEKVLSDALNGIAWVDDRQVEELHVIRTQPGTKGLVVQIEEFVPDWIRQLDLFGERARVFPEPGGLAV